MDLAYSMLRAVLFGGDPRHIALGVIVGMVAALIFFGLSRLAFNYFGIVGVASVLVPWSLFYITYVGLGMKLYRLGRLGLVFGHLIGWLLALQVGLVNLS